MQNTKIVEWVLRIAVFGEFIGHGVFALGFFPSQAIGKSILFLPQKAQWVGWMQNFGISDPALAAKLLMLVGAIDILLAFIVLIRPVRPLLLWMAFWGFWTAIVRPLVGEPIWDFVERWANWGAPLALLLMVGWPKSLKEWFK